MAKRDIRVIKQTPAEAVCDIFGNANQLASLLGYSRSTVCRWNRPKEKLGRDGRIPSRAQDDILKLAKKMGKREVTLELLHNGREIEIRSRLIA